MSPEEWGIRTTNSHLVSLSFGSRLCESEVSGYYANELCARLKLALAHLHKRIKRFKARHVFKRFLRISCLRKWMETHRLWRKTSAKTMFCYWKTPINNKIQTVFPSVNRALNTRKTVVFVELTVKENCWIMERILQFAYSTTTGKLWIFFSENVGKCVNNTACSNIHNLFSKRVNAICFAVFSIPRFYRIDKTFWSVHDVW